MRLRSGGSEKSIRKPGKGPVSYAFWERGKREKHTKTREKACFVCVLGAGEARKAYETELPDEYEESSASMEEEYFIGVDAKRVHQILHCMKEPYKEVFSLRTFGELSFSDIGELFGKTDSWARVTYHRARLMIKEEMNDGDNM